MTMADTSREDLHRVPARIFHVICQIFIGEKNSSNEICREKYNAPLYVQYRALSV
jgi:hypothetical protein